ncbi:GntR family transcriptional regulator [Mycobacterium sp. NPDC003449]
MTVSEQVIAELRSQIIRHELVPGQPVTEDAMANAMGVSRPTIRQALAGLEAEGLLSRSNTNRVLRVTSLSAEDVASAYRARRVLELAGIEAVAHAPQERLDAFWEVIDSIEKAVDSDDLTDQVRTDFRMHESIVDLLDSPDLSTLETQLLTRLRLASIGIASDSEWQKMIRANRDLCALITARRVNDARYQLEERLFESERMVISALTG